MKKAIHYLLICAFLLPITPLNAKNEISQLSHAKKTAKKYLNAVSQCLHGQGCTKEAYQATAAAITSLLALLIIIWGSIGLRILKKQRAQAQEEQARAKEKPIIFRPVHSVPTPASTAPTSTIEKKEKEFPQVSEAPTTKPALKPLFETVPFGQDPLSKAIQEN